ncbi:MAG: hypothetical protein RJA98_1851 [Pseudomonadota bacterium]|jgi:hypothetical protein
MSFKLNLPWAALWLTAVCTTACTTSPMSPATPDAADALRWNPARFETQQLSVNGQTVTVRAFENIVYVRQPVDTTYQVMNVYVPEAYFHGQAVGGYTARTAPIFLPNNVGGYMPAKPGTAQPAAQGPNAGKLSTIAVALSKGYVVASPGARGRPTKDANGVYTGKAPAAIVDLKAAVRWLRFNDAALPGDAEKIIANGTSAGGALSALLGASGNHTDYASHLAALGAADARDDIFAVSAYCPITNLEHADAAYEWQFQGVNDYRKIEISMLDFNMQRKEVAGTLNAAQMDVSNALAPGFPVYVNGLNLRSASGQALTLDAAGNGPFKDAVAAQLMASAQRALDAGTDLSAATWLRISNAQVTGIDFAAYVHAIGRMKQPPAFDDLALASGENQLFGTAHMDTQHFTAYSAAHHSGTAAGGSSADPQTVRMMNAMAYLGAPGARNAPHWRVRHGSADRDTALAVPFILATTLQQQGKTVDFALPWNVPHSGDYDLDALFSWMAAVATQPR